MLKSSFVNIEPKQLNYRDFKNCLFESFKKDLSEVLTAWTNLYETFEDAFKTSLDKYAPKKKKWLRGNNKPHVNKMLREAIMKRSKLKNKANKTKLPVDINNYKKQRSYVVNLNKSAKFEYFKGLVTHSDILKYTKLLRLKNIFRIFWNYFWNVLEISVFQSKNVKGAVIF